MKAIILAAGRGTRLKPLTNSLPKCLAIVINGKSLLEIQLKTLRSCNVTDVSIVRGYQAEKISFSNIRYYFNDDYPNNNILESLFYAEPELKGDVLISYSDIWYERDVVQKLLQTAGDLVLAIDPEWKKAYVGRSGHPVDEAEVAVCNDKWEVLKVGKIVREVGEEDITGEFIGMMKLSRIGCDLIKQHYERARKLYSGKPFQQAAIFQKAYLSNLLQEMADRGVQIQGEPVGGEWMEMDTVEDFERVAKKFTVERKSER